MDHSTNIEDDAILACAAAMTLAPSLCDKVLAASLGRTRLERALDVVMAWASIVHNGWTGEHPPMARDKVPTPAMVDAVRLIRHKIDTSVI